MAAQECFLLPSFYQALSQNKIIDLNVSWGWLPQELRLRVEKATLDQDRSRELRKRFVASDMCDESFASIRRYDASGATEMEYSLVAFAAKRAVLINPAVSLERTWRVFTPKTRHGRALFILIALFGLPLSNTSLRATGEANESDEKREEER